MEYKSKKSIKKRNERPAFWETMLILTVKRQDFVQIFWKSCAEYGLALIPDLDSEPEPEPELEPEPEPEPQ
jgi:hypothetical protein